MPRPLRICLPNLTYHVFSRCIEKSDKLADDYFKDIFLDVMNMALEKYDFEFIDYVIMDNHFHIIIRTVENGATISRIMQFIKSRFAEKYNRINKRTGPFWNERFKDKIMEHSDNPNVYFLELVCYLGFNPVRKKMVNDPRDYKYSSINVYLDENYISPVKITHHKYFLELGDTFEERVKKFLLYEDGYRKRMALLL